jgi:hypothetical protein
MVSESVSRLTIEQAVLAAKAQLHQLALELRRMPIDDEVIHLHLGALELKRDLLRWEREAPASADVQDALDKIERIRCQVAEHWSVHHDHP